MSNKDLHNFNNDLIENESFIKWVKSEFEEDDEMWSAFIDEHPDQTDDINQAISFVRTLDFKDHEAFRQKVVWDRIYSSAGLSTPSEAVVKPLFSIRVKVISLLVAACMLLVLAYRFGFNTETEVKTEYAQQLNESLPDGSRVIISPDSKISYDNKVWNKERTIQLEGTAFFEVKKGTKFTVKTANGNVTVLGTSFSVTSRNQKFDVICKTGKVAVKLYKVDGKESILLPGDKVTLKADSLAFDDGSEEKPNPVTWLDGVYTFDSQPLSEVVSELQRQFNIKISMNNDLSALMYTGFFRKNKLEEALYSVTWPLGLKYSVDKSGNVTISK
ncbi:MAG: FecR domain-containing protein [Saprospiraceae bacterium]|jgi:transmembrane sensor|nr:FecR domain-containing protein [Saprospiraceae bacterium]